MKLSSPKHLKLGQQAEQFATFLLRQNQCHILKNNYYCPYGELDIVALKDNVLCIVEVRLRSYLTYGNAAASVHQKKQEKLIAATSHLLTDEPNLDGFEVRFDLMMFTPYDLKPKPSGVKLGFCVLNHRLYIAEYLSAIFIGE